MRLATPDDVRHIVANLRPLDAEEIGAVADDMDPDTMVARYSPLLTTTWVAEHDGAPAALIGAWPLTREHWRVWAFGTDDFDRVALSLTKHAKRFITPMLVNYGFQQAECESLSTHHTAHEWLLHLGFDRAEDLPGWGRHGEDFIRFVARRSTYV